MNQRAIAVVALSLGAIVAAVAIVSITGSFGFIGAFQGNDPSTVNLDDDPGELLASPESTVTGTVDADEGTEVEVRLRSVDDERPFLMTDTSSVDEDGRFTAVFDLSDIEIDRTTSVTVRSDGIDFKRSVVITPADDP